MFSLAMEAKRSRGMGVVGSTQNILDFIAAKWAPSCRSLHAPLNARLLAPALAACLAATRPPLGCVAPGACPSLPLACHPIRVPPRSAARCRAHLGHKGKGCPRLPRPATATCQLPCPSALVPASPPLQAGRCPGAALPRAPAVCAGHRVGHDYQHRAQGPGAGRTRAQRGAGAGAALHTAGRAFAPCAACTAGCGGLGALRAARVGMQSYGWAAHGWRPPWRC